MEPAARSKVGGVLVDLLQREIHAAFGSEALECCSMPRTRRCASCNPMMDGALVNSELFGKRRCSKVKNEVAKIGHPPAAAPSAHPGIPLYLHDKLPYSATKPEDGRPPPGL